MPRLPDIRSFDDLPLDLKLALSIADAGLARLSDVDSQWAHHYVMSLKRHLDRDPEWSSVHTQLYYILEHAHKWRDYPDARSARAVFRRYLRLIEKQLPERK